MRRLLLGVPFLALVGFVGCPGGGGGSDGGDGGALDGGSDGGCTNGFCTFTLDPSYMRLIADYTPQISVALGPNDRLGIAYYKEDAGIGPDGGPDTSWAIQYMEWQGGVVTVQPEVVQIVHNAYGLSVAFQGNGQPAIAYLGGPRNLQTSTSWWNNDAVVSYRQGPGSWTEQIAVQDSNEALGSNLVSNSGYLVGLYAALAFDGNTAYFAYRDCHNGQSIGTGDYNASDLELAQGGPTGWTHTMLVEGGNDKQAWGGHTRILMAAGQPALVTDKVTGVPSGPGHDVFFLRRDGGSGTWTAPPVLVGQSGDTSSGPSLAYDTGARFGVAYSDRLATGGQALFYTESTTGGASWVARDTIVQAGSSGWYPSLAFDPATHDPVVAFHVCSVRGGVAQLASCPAAEDELQLAERLGGYWYPKTVDPEGALQPALFHLSTGKRAIVYRHPRHGAVRIAVEQ